MSTRTWIRNDRGTLRSDGWEIARDTESALVEDGNVGRPWSLWREGEYVGNYPTVEEAKADAHPVEDDASCVMAYPTGTLGDLDCPVCGREVAYHATV